MFFQFIYSIVFPLVFLLYLPFYLVHIFKRGGVTKEYWERIGFIGAGAIMVTGHAIHGLTTAAGIWVAAGIGMATAAGLYVLAIATTVLSLIGLEVFGWTHFKSRRKRSERPQSRSDDPRPR